MSMVLASLALQAVPARVPVPAPAHSAEVKREIVVIGRQMENWKGGVTKEAGRMVCRTSQSSGDKALDAIRCGAMLSCMKPLEPRIDALMASDRSRREKRDGFDALVKGIEPCLEDYSDKAIARLAEQRAGA